jgi:NAD(P)-dependent dehydrogenase (short-subunit alcohol dehydrogenase family)
VNNIGPGAVLTPIDADVEAKPEGEKALMSKIPLGRWGKPEEDCRVGCVSSIGRGGIYYRVHVFHRWRDVAGVR